MSSVSTAAVKDVLNDLLHAADLEVATETSIERELASKLGIDISDHRELIRAQIADFVRAQVAQATKAKRARSDGSVTQQIESKVHRPDLDTGDFALSDDELTRCSLRAMKGKVYVDLRKFYRKDGERKPGKKGIMLTGDEWSALARHLVPLQAAQARGASDVVVALSGLRKASLFAGKNGLLLDVREWFDKDGEQKPGVKGLSLSSAELKILIDNAESISIRLGLEARGAACTSEQAPAHVSSVDTPAKRGAGSSLPASGTDLLRLGGDTDRFASVKEFKGRCYINLRQHYRKNDQWLPGKKGISLTCEQFRELQKHASDQCDSVYNASVQCGAWLASIEPAWVQALTMALEKKDTTLSIEIGDRRRAYVTEYKSRMYINVREFYEKDGAMLPGSKGLALEPQNWEVLEPSMSGLLAEADRLA